MAELYYWKWDPSLSVGLDVIDNQHRRIVEYINELNSAMHEHAREKVGEVIDQMVDYTVTHFAFEEKLMEKAGYKLLPEHVAVHRSFTRQMHDYKKRFAAGEDVTRDLLSTLRIWLTNHIKRDDKDYSPFVKAMLDKEESWVGKTLRKFFS